MIRALHLTADYPPAVWSGIGRAVAIRAHALHASGVDLTVLDASGQSHPPSNGPRLLRLTPQRSPVDPAAYDLIHLHSLPLAELALQMRHHGRRPLVYTAHSSLADELPPGPLRHAWQPVQDHLFATADAVIFLNHGEHVRVAARFPRLHRRGHVVPHGLVPRATAPAPRDRFVLFAGRFTINKGADLVAHLIAQLAPQGVHFLIAGGHGDADVTARLTAVAHRFPNACRLTGWLSPKPFADALRRAALVLMPSRYEPFGLLALEALHTGAPLLAAPAGGLRDIVTPFSGGEIVSTMTVDRWSPAITTLLDDPARRATLSAYGPAHIARHYHAHRLARRLLNDVYRPLATRSPAPHHSSLHPRPAL